jgi:hypothetical protein
MWFQTLAGDVLASYKLSEEIIFDEDFGWDFMYWPQELMKFNRRNHTLDYRCVVRTGSVPMNCVTCNVLEGFVSFRLYVKPYDLTSWLLILSLSSLSYFPPQSGSDSRRRTQDPIHLAQDRRPHFRLTPFQHFDESGAPLSLRISHATLDSVVVST